jgi:hypothetical protein
MRTAARTGSGVRAFVRGVCPAALLTAGLWAAGGAPPARSIAAVRSPGPIKIDGVLSEPAWARSGDGGFLQSDPADGAPASEPTMVWIAYDDDNLYVAARLADSDPAGIIGLLSRRDDDVDSDWFYFGIDPYLDRRSGFYFAVNPAGSIVDGTLYNDVGTDETWDGIWESASGRDERGWTVELRIPFDQLRFNKTNDQVWGVNFERIIKRKNETDLFAWRPKEESGLVSRFATLTGVHGIKAGRPVEVWPYGLVAAGFSPAQPGNPFRTGHKLTSNAGADLKAGLRNNLTLDATFNPDFGQVEVDPAVVNISDQETYYKEKRPFFVEGADIFRFGTGGATSDVNLGWTPPLFYYSRRIGRHPEGVVTGPGFADIPEWTTILAAAKLTGKPGRDFNLGLVSALTGRERAELDRAGVRSREDVEPLTYYGVLRGLKEFDDGQRGFGFIGTSVLRAFDGSEPLRDRLSRTAFTLGVDGWTALDRANGWALTGWLGGTIVTGSRAAMTRLQTSALHYYQRPDQDYVRVDENATSLRGWAGRLYLNRQHGRVIFNTELCAQSPGFEANDLGYHARGDLINGHVQLGYQSFHPGSLTRRWLGMLSYYQTRDFGGNRIGEYWYVDGEAQLLNYWTCALHLDYEPPKFSHYLTRGGPMAYYPSGQTEQVKIESDDRKPLVATFQGHYRTHPDGGYNWSSSLGLAWKPGERLSLALAPGYTFRYSQGEWVTKVTDPLMVETYGVRYILSDIIQKALEVEVRANWTFTPRLSLQAYLQPYVGTGDYKRFKELAAARTFRFNVFGQADSSTLTYDGHYYTADPDGPGPARPFRFANPDFSLKSLRGTIVLRWEYRPGSMLYLVWTQRRTDESHPGDFDVWRDFEDLWRAPGDNIVMLKMTYRFEI